MAIKTSKKQRLLYRFVVKKMSEHEDRVRALLDASEVVVPEERAVTFYDLYLASRSNVDFKANKKTIIALACISVVLVVLYVVSKKIKSKQTKNAKSMTISDNGKKFIKQWEGLRLKAYQDVAGVWTIGYGHTGGVSAGQIITQAQADTLFDGDILKHEAPVQALGVKLRQNQYDALVSFVYNTGRSTGTTLWNKVKANPNDLAIRNEFAKWIYSSGKVISGLINRRKAEADLYFS